MPKTIMVENRERIDALEARVAALEKRLRRPRFLEIATALLGIGGYAAVIALPGVWWTLIPWLTSNALAIGLNMRLGLYWIACQFAIYWGVTAAGLWGWAE